MRNISLRRQIFTAILLGIALIGSFIYFLAPRPSTARDMGALMMVMWLPVVGNVIGWLRRRARPTPPPMNFAPGSAFVSSARIALTLLPAEVPAASRPIRAGLFPCLIALGEEAFVARLQVFEGQEPETEVTQEFDLQFLRPERTLARMPVGTAFTLLMGRVVLGRGVVLAHAAAG